MDPDAQAGAGNVYWGVFLRTLPLRGRGAGLGRKGCWIVKHLPQNSWPSLKEEGPSESSQLRLGPGPSYLPHPWPCVAPRKGM